MRDNPERFIESNAKNSWLRYLNNMYIQGTWAEALIIQTVADVLKVSNSNWTEWSTIQGVIVRVISKSDEREARGRFEITSTNINRIYNKFRN